MTTPHDGLASRTLTRIFESAPTATRTRDLLLRRHFRSVVIQRWISTEVLFGRYGGGWTRPDVALDLGSLAPRLAP